MAPDASERAADIGMRLERWTVEGTRQLVLFEEERRGAGAYLFSLDHPIAGSPWLLWQAPHPYFDQRTGDIAAALYFHPPPGPSPAAFFTSTLHRYTQEQGVREKRADNPADPCHSPAHLFNVATESAAGAFPGATVVQLHGFNGGDEDGDRPPAGASVVVSAGQRAPTPLSVAAAAGLTRIYGDNALLYPTQTRALGARTNVQLVVLMSAPGARFLHVEVSAALRDTLAEQPDARDAFGAALFAVATAPDAPP